jgi:hypothetical protein
LSRSWLPLASHAVGIGTPLRKGTLIILGRTQDRLLPSLKPIEFLAIRSSISFSLCRFSSLTFFSDSVRRISIHDVTCASGLKSMQVVGYSAVVTSVRNSVTSPIHMREKLIHVNRNSGDPVGEISMFIISVKMCHL